jgi:hypothetical protein
MPGWNPPFQAPPPLVKADISRANETGHIIS